MCPRPKFVITDPSGKLATSVTGSVEVNKVNMRFLGFVWEGTFTANEMSGRVYGRRGEEGEFRLKRTPQLKK